VTYVVVLIALLLATLFISAFLNESTPTNAGAIMPRRHQHRIPQYELVETVQRSADGIGNSPYKKYVYGQRFNRLLMEDGLLDPLVRCEYYLPLWLGPRRSTALSDFPFLRDYECFQGSVPMSVTMQHFKNSDRRRGTMNGSTSTDRTNLLFKRCPLNQLENLTLWLEAGFAWAFLLEAVTQEKFGNSARHG